MEKMLIFFAPKKSRGHPPETPNTHTDTIKGIAWDKPYTLT